MPTLRSLGDNWKLKALALALAVLLWVVVSAEQVTSNWIPVPLEVHVTDPAYRLVEGSVPGEVEVRFTGPGRNFLDLAIRRSPLVLNISDVSDTVQSFALEPSMVRVPAQLSVNPQDVRPGRVSLRFTSLSDRNVPVQVRVRDQLGGEWMLIDTLRVEPPAVRLRGPAEAVNQVELLRTEPFTLSPANPNFSTEVPLDVENLPAGVQISSRSVRVSGTIDRIVTVTHPEVRVSIGPGVVIRPLAVRVTLRGPERVVDALAPGAYRVAVAIDSIPGRVPADGMDARLRVEGLPAGVVAETVPASVRLLPAPTPRPSSADTSAADTAAERDDGGD